MLSLGWSELGIIFIIIVVVVGPNEIPNLLKQFGKVTKKVKSISRDFNTSINNIVKEAEIDEFKKNVNIDDLQKKVNEEVMKNTSNITDEFKEINSSLKNLDKNLNKSKNIKSKKSKTDGK
tara:strand:- start:189 stop:551 length:363 start_codon:yes stop_codon:yes gene_type:complete